jgi:uncharacterized protein (DUF2062 family)
VLHSASMYIMTGFRISENRRCRQIWQLLISPVQRTRVLLTSGLTPRKLAQTLCIGVAFGVIPLVWGTTILCLILASVFRLNHVALQSVNYLLWPVHVALLVPFYKLGMWLFPGGPAVPPQIYDQLLQNPASSLHFLGWITLKAVTVWMITVLPGALCTYWVVLSVTASTETVPSDTQTSAD